MFLMLLDLEGETQIPNMKALAQMLVTFFASQKKSQQWLCDKHKTRISPTIIQE